MQCMIKTHNASFREIDLTQILIVFYGAFIASQRDENAVV